MCSSSRYRFVTSAEVSNGLFSKFMSAKTPSTSPTFRARGLFDIPFHWAPFEVGRVPEGRIAHRRGGDSPILVDAHRRADDLVQENPEGIQPAVAEGRTGLLRATRAE